MHLKETEPKSPIVKTTNLRRKLDEDYTEFNVY